ncbi:MAG: hypothetical protein HY088_10430 [Ignavibacteriales bacterium]|nr:hypothetical protein [Ignavibacteriales bacterium]
MKNYLTSRRDSFAIKPQNRFLKNIDSCHCEDPPKAETETKTKQSPKSIKEWDCPPVGGQASPD